MKSCAWYGNFRIVFQVCMFACEPNTKVHFNDKICKPGHIFPDIPQKQFINQTLLLGSFLSLNPLTQEMWSKPERI